MEDGDVDSSPPYLRDQSFSYRKKQLYLPVASQPPHLTACILSFHLPVTFVTPEIWRTFRNAPVDVAAPTFVAFLWLTFCLHNAGVF